MVIYLIFYSKIDSNFTESLHIDFYKASSNFFGEIPIMG